MNFLVVWLFILSIFNPAFNRNENRVLLDYQSLLLVFGAFVVNSFVVVDLVQI